MNRANAPSYDLFKLLVTIALIVILALMLLRGCATSAASPVPTEDNSVSGPTESSVLPSETEADPATSTAEEFTPSPAVETATVAVSLTPTLDSTTSVAESTTPTADAATSPPESTATEPAATESTAPTTTTDNTSCNTSVASRLSVGQEARVVQRLNLRNAANILAPILQTSPINTQVEIIGGPVCTPVGERAYLWWQIRAPSGVEGWSAESPLNEATYLLEPIP